MNTWMVQKLYYKHWQYLNVTLEHYEKEFVTYIIILYKNIKPISWTMNKERSLKKNIQIIILLELNKVYNSLFWNIALMFQIHGL